MSDKQLKSNMSSVPIWKKMNLTVEEASEYSGIGTSKIKELSNCEDCPFVLWNGAKRLIKRNNLRNTCHRSIPSDGVCVMGNKQTELNNSGNQVETVPVWVKPYLTIDEATRLHRHRQETKLYEMTSREKCPFVLWVGNRRMIKRRVFDEYIEHAI